MSLINVVTNTEESVASGGIIPLTTITRRTGCALNLNSNSIVITKPGYYILDANVTFESQVEGTETITVYKNGVLVPGASATITTAASTIYTAGINTTLRTFINEPGATITLVGTGGAITIQNANLRILNA